MSTTKCSEPDCVVPLDAHKVECGVCLSRYHYRCVNLKKTDSAAINENAAIMWKCTNCMSGESGPTLREAVSCLMDCTKAVSELLSKLTPLIEKLSDTTFQRHDINFPPGKRKRPDRSDDDQASHRSEETPRGPPRPREIKAADADLRFGTLNEPSCSIKAAKPVIKSSKRRSTTSTEEDDPSLKHLYVTKLDPSTTEADILKYISEKIAPAQVEGIQCKKLVKTGCTIEDLNFISFKVAAPINLSATLGEANFWPLGVAVRGFTFRPRPPNAAFLV